MIWIDAVLYLVTAAAFVAMLSVLIPRLKDFSTRDSGREVEEHQYEKGVVASAIQTTIEAPGITFRPDGSGPPAVWVAEEPDPWEPERFLPADPNLSIVRTELITGKAKEMMDQLLSSLEFFGASLSELLRMDVLNIVMVGNYGSESAIGKQRDSFDSYDPKEMMGKTKEILHRLWIT